MKTENRSVDSRQRFQTPPALIRSALSAWLIFAVSAAASFAAEPTLVSCRCNQQAMLSSDFCKRLTALPEWEPFVRVFTEACDSALVREVPLERLEKHLPRGIVDDLLEAIDKGWSTRKLIEGYFAHVEAVVFELQADLDRLDLSDSLKDLARLAQNAGRASRFDVDGMLAFVIDVDPRKGLEYLKYLREGEDFEFLHNDDPDGDFILSFKLEARDRQVRFCCSRVKLAATGKYALIFSGRSNAVRLAEEFKTGKYADSDFSKPAKELAVEEACFLFLDKQAKRAGWGSNGLEIFGKIKRLSARTRDVDGTTRFETSIVMRTADEARQIRQMLEGLIALAQLSQNPAEGGVDWFRLLRIEHRDDTVSLAVKLDDPGCWKLIAQSLRQATEEIRKRR